MPPRRRANFGASLTSGAGDASSAAADTDTPSESLRTPSHSPKSNPPGSAPKAGAGENSTAISKKPKATPKQSHHTARSLAKMSPTDVTVAASAADSDSGAAVEVCFICAEPMHVHAVYPCNHTTCGRCALRLRALYKQESCVYCKSDAKTVVFTRQPGRLFASFTPEETSWRDERLGLHFACKREKEGTLELLLFHCSHVECNRTLPASAATVAGILPAEAVGGSGPNGALQGWPGLREHVASAHQRCLCELCTQHKKIFTYEHLLYTDSQLSAHLVDDHRKCEFCNKFFYGPDELYKHLRDKHFQCQMCAVFATPEPVPNANSQEGGDNHESRHRRRAAAAAADHAAAAAAEAQTWYRDYFDLERHFDKKHFLCQDPICRQQQYVVFGNEMDYNSHRLKEHASTMSAKDKRDALRVDATFGEGSSSAGSSVRGQTPTGGSSTPRPSRRAGFGGRLTEAVPTQSPARDTEAAAQQAFIGLATAVLGPGFSSSKLASLRTGLAVYRVGEAAADDLAATVWSVVDSNPAGDHPDAKLQNGASLIRGLADSLLSTGDNSPHAEEKATELLRSWTTLAATRNSFPVLGQANSRTFGNGYASAAGTSGATRRAVGAINRSAAAMDFFPALPATAPVAAPAPLRTPQRKWGAKMPRPPRPTPAASASPSAHNAHVPGTAAHAAQHRVIPTSSKASWTPPATPAPSAPRPKPTVQTIVHSTPSMSASKVKPQSAAAFPGLPQKATQADKWEQKLKETRDKVSGKGGPSVWAPSVSSAGPSDSADFAVNTTSGAEDGNRKGKGKKKQTVITLGSVRR